MKQTRIAAVILAAGFSSRMGTFKPLLEIGGKTLLERNIDLFSGAGIAQIITVAGHNAHQLEKIIAATPSECVINQRYGDGMLSSVKQGAALLQDRCDGFFLLPVDIPLVQISTIETLLKAFASGRCHICYPRHDEKRGHPPLIDADLIPEILSYPGEGGLRQLLRDHASMARDVDVDDPFILHDIDTREDYDSLMRLMRENQTEKDAS